MMSKSNYKVKMGDIFRRINMTDAKKSYKKIYITVGVIIFIVLSLLLLWRLMPDNMAI